MNASNVQDLHTRSTQQGGPSHVQTPSSSSSSNSLTRHRGPPPFVSRTTRIPPRTIHSRHDQPGGGLSVDFPTQIHREIGRPHPGEDPVKSVDKVFNVYGERLRTDLRDMHGLCTQLVAQEKQEAAKWYALCAKVIVERDHARRRLAAHEPDNSPSSSGQLDSVGHHFTSKRSRNVSSHSRESSFDTSSARSTVENRPIRSSKRSLRLSRVQSPPASPSPGLSASPPASRTEFSPFEERPAKLRRSCDLSNLISYDNEPGGSHTSLDRTSSSPPHVVNTNLRIKQQSRTPSPFTHAGDGFTSNFSHVDLMYVSAKGEFVCRACLLEKSKKPCLEPKAFPVSASWDELRDHCVRLHPEACADVSRLQPAEIFELRRRLSR